MQKGKCPYPKTYHAVTVRVIVEGDYQHAERAAQEMRRLLTMNPTFVIESADVNYWGSVDDDIK